MPTTATESQTVRISSADQNIWAPGDRFDIEWHEYFPILGGDRTELTVSDVSITEGKGKVTQNGTRINWDPEGEYDSLTNGQSSNIVIEYFLTDPDGAREQKTFHIQARGTTEGTGYFTPSNKDTYAEAFSFAAVEADDALQTGHVFERVTPIDIDFNAMDEIGPALQSILSDFTQIVNSAYDDYYYAQQNTDLAVEKWEKESREAGLVDTVILNRVDWELKAALADAAALAAKTANDLQDAVESADLARNTKLASYYAANTLKDGLSEAVDLAEEAVDIATGAVSGAVSAVNSLISHIEDAVPSWLSGAIMTLANFLGLGDELRAANNAVSSARSALAREVDALADAEADFSAAQAALDVAYNAYSTAFDTAVDAAANLSEFLADQTIGGLETASEAAAAARLAAYNAYVDSVYTMWEAGVLVNELPDAGDLIIENGEAALAGTELAGFEALELTAKGAYELVSLGYDLAQGAINGTALDIEAKTSVQVTAQAGLQIDLVIDAGSVDTDIDYTLDTTTVLDVDADTFTINANATNATTGQSVAFNTISPNLLFYAGIAYDIVADYEIYIDLYGAIAGAELFDIPSGSEPLDLDEVIGMSGWIDLINFDSTNAGTLEVPLPDWVGDILSIELNFPTVETQGREAEVSAGIYTDQAGFSMDELAAAIVSITEAKLEYSPEFKALLIEEGASTEIGTTALSDAFGAIFDSITGDGDTDGDGVVPIFLLSNADTGVDGIFHINTIADVISEIDINNVGELGFFVSEGESDNIIQFTVDVDQLVATIVNVALGNQPSSTINPLDLSVGLSTLFEKTSISQSTIDTIEEFVSVEFGFEIADLDVRAGANFSQKFALSVDDMDFTVTFEDGKVGTFSADEGGEIVINNASELVDTNGDGDIDYTLALTPDATFFNDTQVGLNVGYTLDFIKAHATLLAGLPFDKIFEGLDLSAFGAAALDAILPEVGFDLTFGPVLRLDGDLDVVSADIFEDIFEFNAGTASVAGSFVPAPVQVAPSGMVSINGNVRQGAVLTADTSALSDANGMGALSYQWQRDGADIAEATEMEYIPIQSDVDAVMTVVVSYIDGLGMAEGVTSSQTAAVANVNDLPTGTVTISGNVENVIVDQVLTATVEGLTDPDGLGTLSYQWFNGDVEIATSGGVLEITNPDGSTTLITDRAFNAEEAGFLTGETASTYTVREEDQGKNISVRVSYTDGYGSNDYLDGTREDVVLYSITGNGVANVLVGTERDEYIQGLGGNDMISGVGGADVLSGSIGEDYIFGDAFELRYALTEANQVFRLYQATFAREPDEAGHKGWATRLFTGEQSLAQVTQGFVKSQEFAKTYDGLGQSAFVAELYKNVLGRDIDAGEVTAAEIAGWTDLMKAGLDRAGVVNGFSESAEFKKTTLQDANSFSVNGNPAEWSDEVYRLYRATLDRDPDFGGFAAWSDILAGGRAFEQVISGFASSPEFKNAYGDLSDPAAFVTQLYSNVLDRSPDDLGLADWVDLLNSGTTREAVVRGFAQSGEFRQNTASDLKAWMRSEGVDDDIDGGAGTNVLAGGAMADKFIFRQTIASTNTVLDLEAWDYLSFEGFGYTSAADAKSHMTQVAGGVAFSDQGTDVTFQRFQLSDISDDMFLL